MCRFKPLDAVSRSERSPALVKLTGTPGGDV